MLIVSILNNIIIINAIGGFTYMYIPDGASKICHVMSADFVQRAIHILDPQGKSVYDFVHFKRSHFIEE